MQHSIQISAHKKEVSTFPKMFIYPFFLIHMGMFGLSWFMMAYNDPPAPLFFLYLHGGIAILVYCIFYIWVFWLDTVRWMFINAILSIVGVFSQMGYLVKRFFWRDISSYPLPVHLTPVLYFILYTFLLRQLVIDIFYARDNPRRLYMLNVLYIFGMFFFYFFAYYARSKWE